MGRSCFHIEKKKVKMTEITRKITVDLARRGNVRLIFARQNDFNSRRIVVNLTDGGVPFKVEKTNVAIFNFARPDGESGAFAGQIEDDGSVSIVLGGWPLSVVGEVKCSLSIFSDDEKKLTSADFYLDVEIALYIGEDITEDKDYSMLTALMSEISKINVIERARHEAEVNRSYAENSRVMAENKREDNEYVRKYAEDMRKKAELARESAEASRVLADESRDASDRARDDAESLRASAEGKRVLAENERKNAELDRNKFLGDIEGSVNEIIDIQQKILRGDAAPVAKEEVIKAINETLLIADDLETDDPYKALSAAQGVVLKALADSATKTVSGWYNGTDSKILELVFPFAPKFVFIAGMYNYDRDEDSRTVGRDFGIILPQESFMLRQTGGNTDIDHVSEGAPYILLDGTTVTLDASKISTKDYSIIFNRFSYAGSYTSSPATRETIYGYRYFAIG